MMALRKGRVTEGDAGALLKHLDKQLRCQDELEEGVVVRTQDLNTRHDRLTAEAGGDAPPSPGDAKRSKRRGSRKQAQ